MISSSRARSAFQARSVGDTGRTNQLLPFSRKRAALLARQHPPHRVLPVRRVEDELPDVVPPDGRPPRGLGGRHAAQRSAAGSVPARPCVRRTRRAAGSEADLAHRRPPCARRGTTFSSAGATGTPRAVADDQGDRDDDHRRREQRSERSPARRRRATPGTRRRRDSRRRRSRRARGSSRRAGRRTP